MIRWKILRLDDPSLLAYAKAQVTRNLSGGELAFQKKLFVGTTEIDIKAIHAPGTIIAYISIVAARNGDPLIPLGGTAATLDVFQGRPVPPASRFTTATSILNALLASPAISYVSPYISTTNAYVLSDKLFGVDNITDPQAGSIAIIDITSPIREYDLAAKRGWVEYKTKETYQRGWAAISLPCFVEPYTQNFAVSYVTDPDTKEKKIPDGPQTFSLPMVGGKFRLDLTVQFKDNKVQSSTSGDKIGDWAYSRILVTLVDKTTIKVVYQQTYKKRNVFVALSSREFHLPQSEPGYGSVVDNYTNIDYTYSTLPVKFATPSIAPAYFLTKSYYNQQVIFGFRPGETVLTVVERIEQSTTSLSVMNSDGTTTVLTGERGDLHPDSSTPAPYVIFGEHGAPRTGTGTYGSPRDADNGTWTDTLGAYSLRHYRPGSIPDDNEAYDVVYAGATVRSALKGRYNYFNGSATEDDITQDTTLSGTSNDGFAGLTHWGDHTTFPEYDAAVSVVPDVLVIVQINVANGTFDSVAIAVLPYGWGEKCIAKFREFSYGNVPDDATRRQNLVDMRDEFQDAIDLNHDFTNTSEAEASVAKMAELIRNIDFASYKDPDEPPDTPARVPTNADIRKVLLKYFKPITKVLTEATIPEEVALAAGGGTYLLAKGTTVSGV